MPEDLGCGAIGSEEVAREHFLKDDIKVHFCPSRFKDAVQVELAVINGQWGVLRFIDGVLESVQSFETDGERIVRIHVQRNPDKLVRIAAARDE